MNTVSLGIILGGVLVAVTLAAFVADRRSRRGRWPRTLHDRIDVAFAREYRNKHYRFIRDWERRTICGCGDVLQTDEERRDGVCETCLALGTRTPRPMEVEGEDDA